jgi:hypothetical protein
MEFFSRMRVRHDLTACRPKKMLDVCNSTAERTQMYRRICSILT